MITEYGHVLEALQMPDVFSNEVISALTPEHTVDLLPQYLDPPQHTAMRRVLNRWFSAGGGTAARTARAQPLRRADRRTAPQGRLQPGQRLRDQVPHRPVPRHPEPAYIRRGRLPAPRRERLQGLRRPRARAGGDVHGMDPRLLRPGHRRAGARAARHPGGLHIAAARLRTRRRPDPA